MGQSMMTEGQQNDLDIRRPQTGRPSLGAKEERLRFVGHAMEDGSQLAAIAVAPQIEKGKAPQLLEEKSIGSRARDAKGKAALTVEIEDERVGQHAADRAGVDIVALGRATLGPQPVPVGEEFHRDGKLHLIPRPLFKCASRNGTRASPQLGLARDEAGIVPFPNGSGRAPARRGACA